MQPTLPDVGPLTAAGLEQVLTAAMAAPSLHNSQPWSFSVNPAGITVHADLTRALPAADPDHRELLLACGAAVLNLRLAIRAQGVGTTVTLLPDPRDRTVVARIVPSGRQRTTAAESSLAAAIPHRHTNRRPMDATDLPPGVLEQLRDAARVESCWLAPLSTASTYEAGALVVLANRAQQSDAAYCKEFAEWTGRGPDTVDGVPATSSGPLPEPQDRLLLRDFSGGTAQQRPPGKDFESDPLLVVIGSFHDLPLAWIQAGAAMQRVLLAATAAGLATSFLSQLIEVTFARDRLRELIGGALWPQAVLRLGRGLPGVASPRRPLAEVVVTPR